MPATAESALYTTADLRQVEALAAVGAQPPLMERAGRTAADLALRLTAQDARPILIACGPGNNGGDGFVMARHLRAAGREVAVAFYGDPAHLPAGARAAHTAWRQSGGTEAPALPPAPPPGWALAVDALFGIGLTRPIAAPWADWIDRLNALPAPRLALDLPSGLEADTGHCLGPTFRADHTLTFLAHKPGCHTADGVEHCGQLHLAPLGIDAPALMPPSGSLVTTADCRTALPPRRPNSHKGSHGTVALLGGDLGMVGALWLAARAALLLGSGRVLAAALDPHAPTIDPLYPEIMPRPADALPDIATVLALGPGLGQSDAARAHLARLLPLPLPAVLDADALNLIAAHPDLLARLTSRTAPTLLTPHPAEAARLLDTDTATIQRHRIRAALRLAAHTRAHVLLKGCGTLLATPDGHWQINPTGTSALATAGSGDVLTGITAAFLAQGAAPHAALAAAAHLHGLAAEALTAQNDAPIGLNAGALAPAARRILNAGWQCTRC